MLNKIISVTLEYLKLSNCVIKLQYLYDPQYLEPFDCAEMIELCSID